MATAGSVCITRLNHDFLLCGQPVPECGRVENDLRVQHLPASPSAFFIQASVLPHFSLRVNGFSGQLLTFLMQISANLASLTLFLTH